jgi:hypothetical protein
MARPQVENNVRSLVRLHRSGSTARALNLLKVAEAAQNDNDPLTRPFFSHPIMNRSFVVKHRLRSNEVDIFTDGRTTATKLLIPIDFSNLDAGGRYVYIDQPNYLESLSEAIGVDISRQPADIRMMKALDKLPSFDPFLLREWLARFDLKPDSRYFELSFQDAAKMENFVFHEISQLVSMSLSGQSHNEAINRLVKKMLSSHYDNELEPLRQTLRLSETEFREGMFAWKGFLYYKWSAKDIEAAIPGLVREMKDRQPRRGVDHETLAQLEASRRQIGRTMVVMFNQLADRIKDYDTAYHGLVREQNPMAFKTFLKAAPSQFVLLGDSLGQLQHVIHFWRYRTRGKADLPFEEYSDMLRDFEDSLGAQLG